MLQILAPIVWIVVVIVLIAGFIIAWVAASVMSMVIAACYAIGARKNEYVDPFEEGDHSYYPVLPGDAPRIVETVARDDVTGPNVESFHQTVIRPVLEFMARNSAYGWLGSENAQILMLSIAVTESDLRYTRQIAKFGKNGEDNVYGPARSYFQVEPATAYDCLKRRLPRMPDAIEPFIPSDAPTGSVMFEEAMRYDQALGCMLARLKIMDAGPAVPPWHDPEAQAVYWKRFYNTIHGAGTPSHFLDAVTRHKILRYAELTFGGVKV